MAKSHLVKSTPRISASMVWYLARQTLSEWQADKAPRLGAALAFYSVLSLAPLLLLTLAAATDIWGREAAEGQIVDQMIRVVGEEAAAAIQNILTTTSQHRDAGIIATLTGFGTLLFSASGMFGELQAAMNIIWKAKPRPGRPILLILKERLFSFCMVMVTGILLLASLLVSAAIATAAHELNDIVPQVQRIMQIADSALSFGIITVMFALIFKVIPDVDIPWKSVWLGSALTALMFIAGKALIGLYFSVVNVGSSYGATGSIIVLLLWIYFSAQLLFLGAEFTYVYSSYFKLHPGQDKKDLQKQP